VRAKRRRNFGGKTEGATKEEARDKEEEILAGKKGFTEEEARDKEEEIVRENRRC
jgi:hypothetical protein